MSERQTVFEMMRSRARAAIRKLPLFGPDIDLEAYSYEAPEQLALQSLGQLPEDVRADALKAGIDPGESGRSGSFFQMDNSVRFSSALQPGLEVMSISDALKKHPWLKEYWWKAVAVDADKFTAWAELHLHHGYFIRALPGAKITLPVQACLYMSREMFSQNVHNIILAEEGSELHIITGCTTGRDVRKGVHVGISEFYVKTDARVSFTMIHNWAPEVAVRPRSGAIVDEGGVFVSNYVCMRPVQTLQMYPAAYLNGRGAVARYNSILVAGEGSSMDVGGKVVLNGAESRAEVVARAVSTGGTIVSRGNLTGSAPGIKAHLECRGLILGDRGRIVAIPELEGNLADVDMSHEAALGKIASDEIQYLTARGLTEEEAEAAIVRGFLDIDIKGLPEQLKDEIRRAVQQGGEGSRLF